jgi:nitrogen fixation/metabolism regulation signal transduction histidine kinase
MLRRKLMLVLGSMVALLLVAAVSAIMLLHNVLTDLIQASSAATTGAAETHLLQETMNTVETGLQELRREPRSPDEALVGAITALGVQVQRLGDAAVLPADATPCYERVRERVGILSELVAPRPAATDAVEWATRIEAALLASGLVREELTDLSHRALDESAAEHERLVRKFRGAAIVVGICFLVLLNASIIVVLRTAAMVLRPVDELVEASRRLGREEFGHRIEIDTADEFGELAHAYNGLAEQLQANERRKIETLQQVARTLNHELNNAISTIDLQLTVMDRRSAGDQAMAKPLRQIHDTLDRMSHTIDALKRVRKIVLTDYLSGVKMLDLERSVADDSPSGETPATGPVSEIRFP